MTHFATMATDRLSHDCPTQHPCSRVEPLAGSHVSRTLLSVGGICIPEQPDFADKSEEVVWSALRTRLQPDDVLLHGIRFTDPTEGDVEIDLILLIPSLGAIAIEVKGGYVTYSDGGFLQSDADVISQNALKHTTIRKFNEDATIIRYGPQET